MCGVCVGMTNMPSPRPLLPMVGLAARFIPEKRVFWGVKQAKMAQNTPFWPILAYFGTF